MPQDDETPFSAPQGLLEIGDCIDADGEIALPPGETLVSLIDRNVANVGDTVAYRYLDFARSEGEAVELTWAEFDVRVRAIAARVQQTVSRGERVAILAPQGLDYVCAFFAVLKAGSIAVPLFAPELPGHAERLTVALADSAPVLLLTTRAAAGAVEGFLDKASGPGDVRAGQVRPPVLVVDDIPDAASDEFIAVDIESDDVSHLQYTSGATRPPVGVEITHRAFLTNLTQMILSIDLLNRNTHGVSWLPLYHDMGLSMIGFPATYGGHSTLMSPTAFVRRPYRWIRALSDASLEGRVVTAAPNFAYEWAAARGLPPAGEDIDLANVVMIIGSEPVSMTAIDDFNKAFGPHGLPATAIKPSYGIAEATLFIANIPPDAVAHASHFDGDRLAGGDAVAVSSDAPNAVAAVSCGVVARSLRAVVVDPATATELPDGRVGEFWLHGDNVGRGYFNDPESTRLTFEAKLAVRQAHNSHAEGVAADANWLRTGDLGMYHDGEVYVVGRIADQLSIGDRKLHPHEIETTVADASPLVRRGYVAAVGVPGSGTWAGEHGDHELVIIAERAAGTGRSDPQAAVAAIREAVSRRHGVDVADVRLLQAGGIPRTTSGKLARRAARAGYLDGSLGGRIG